MQIRTLDGPLMGPIYCVDFSPDGTMVVSGGGEQANVKIWNADTGAEVRSDPGSCVGPYAIAYRRVPVPGLCARTRRRVKIWNAATGAEVCSFAGVC